MRILNETIVCNSFLYHLSGFRMDWGVELSLFECHAWCILLFYCVQSDSWYDPNASKCPTHTHSAPISIKLPALGQSYVWWKARTCCLREKEKDDFTGFIIFRLKISLYTILTWYVSIQCVLCLLYSMVALVHLTFDAITSLSLVLTQNLIKTKLNYNYMGFILMINLIHIYFYHNTCFFFFLIVFDE